MVYQIKNILKERKMSQTQLAERMGISVQQLNNAISGRYQASLTLLQKVAQALDVEFWQLFAPANIRKLAEESKTPKKSSHRTVVEDVQCCPYCQHELHIQLK